MPPKIALNRATPPAGATRKQTRPLPSLEQGPQTQPAGDKATGRHSQAWFLKGYFLV